MELVIITGMSGAGKSSIVSVMEDIGFFCVDNLPAELVCVFANLLKNSSEHKRVAVIIDIRSGSSFSQLLNSLSSLTEQEIDYKLMFIDAKDDELVKRYKETRRKHPLMKSSTDLISQLVLKERILLEQARDVADYLIDTTDISVGECKKRVREIFVENSQKQMHIHFMSFGFKHGLLSEADYVFDVRFLPNPYYIPELKPLTGLDQEIRDYVMSFELSQEFKQKLTDLIELVVPSCIKEGRSQLVIAIGCTGGHHRSVTFVKDLYDSFIEKGYSASISHRDILR